MLHPLGSVPGLWHKVTGNTILSLFLNLNMAPFKLGKQDWVFLRNHSTQELYRLCSEYADYAHNAKQNSRWWEMYKWRTLGRAAANIIDVREGYK